MTFPTRAANAVFVLAAMGTAFGAGYGAHANRFPAQWRWPLNPSPTSPLTRTADGNVMVAAADVKAPRSFKPDLRPYETLDEVRRAIKDNFVSTKVDDTQITDGAIRGMLRSLGDRFTRYLAPSDYSEFLSSNKGEFTGIGARIDVQDDYAGSAAAKPFGASRPYIVEPIAGGPAQKAGLKRGDVILAVNGKSTADMSEDATIAYIRGTRGTAVSLKVERKLNSAKVLRDIKFNTFDVQLTRDVIELNPVTFQWLPDQIAWMKLDEFNEKTDVEIANALKQLKAGQNGAPARGLVFDMRGNPGGLLTAAVNVGSRFIKTGPIVFQRERTGDVRPLTADPSRFMDIKVPIVVLVDGYSASAAEIVTGALKDNSRATVVGARTFGKASVQVLVDLTNGGALVITTAKYLTPGKHDISDKGIAPDIAINASAEDNATGRGLQLQKAVEVIESKISTPPIITARAN